MTDAAADPPPWLGACEKAIEELGGVRCDDAHCQTDIIKRFIHTFCTCEAPYLNGCTGPNPSPDCCQFTAASPAPLVPYNCYCCCGEGSGAEVQAAGTGAGYRPLREYVPGDEVYVVGRTSP